MRSFIRISGIVGLAAPIFAYVCILLSINSWNQFSWTNNALSDLGVQNGLTSVLFNSGLVISGFLFMVYAIGLFQLVGKRLAGKIGVAFLFLSTAALVAIGVFNENFSPTHVIVSVIFFVFLPVSLLIFVWTFWSSGNHRLSIFTLALALTAAAPWVLQFTFHYVSNVAIPEFVSGLAGSAWTIAVDYLMIKKPS